MDAQIREDKVLEFKALTMSKSVFAQVPTYKPTYAVDPIGWVNHEGEWYIASINGHLVRIRRVDLVELYITRATEKEEGLNYAQIQERFDARRGKMPQIFLK